MVLSVTIMIMMILSLSSVKSQAYWQPSQDIQTLDLENIDQLGPLQNHWIFDKGLTMMMKRNWIYDNGLLKRFGRNLKRRAMKNGKIRLL